MSRRLLSLEEKIAAAIAGVSDSRGAALDDELDDELPSDDEPISPLEARPAPRSAAIDAPSNLAGAGGLRSFLDDFDDFGDGLSAGSGPRGSSPSSARKGRARAQEKSADRSQRSLSRGSASSSRSSVHVSSRLHAYAKTKQQRMKKKRAEHMRERYTFTPSLVSSPGKSTEAASPAKPQRAAEAAARLYESGLKMHKKRSEVARDPYAHGHSFKPTLIASRSADVYGGGSSSLSNLTGQARLDRMHDTAAMMAKKKRIAEEEQQTRLTFKPKITSKGKVINSPSLVDRFVYAPSPDKLSARKKQMQAMKLREDGVTFRPTLYTKGAKTSHGRGAKHSARRFVTKRERDEFYARMHGRAAEFAKEVEETRQELEKEQMRGTTFTPELATRESRSKGGIVVRQKKKTFERMYRVAQQYKESAKAAKKEQLEEEMAGVTFAPDLSATAPRSPSTADKTSSNKERRKLQRSHDRSRHAEYQRAQQRLVREKSRLEREEWEECTFVPDISATSPTKSAPASERREMASESWARLTTDRTPVKLLRAEMKKQLDLAGCTFSPRLSARARESGEERVEDDIAAIGARLHEEAKEAQRVALMRERERAKRELEDHTFKPTIPERSRQHAARKARRSAKKSKKRSPKKDKGRRQAKARGAEEPPPLTPSAQARVEANACAKKDGRFSPKEIESIRSKLRAASYTQGTAHVTQLYRKYQAKRMGSAGRGPVPEALDSELAVEQFKNMLCKEAKLQRSSPNIDRAMARLYRALQRKSAGEALSLGQFKAFLSDGTEKQRLAYGPTAAAGGAVSVPPPSAAEPLSRPPPPPGTDGMGPPPEEGSTKCDGDEEGAAPSGARVPTDVTSPPAADAPVSAEDSEGPPSDDGGDADGGGEGDGDGEAEGGAALAGGVADAQAEVDGVFVTDENAPATKSAENAAGTLPAIMTVTDRATQHKERSMNAVEQFEAFAAAMKAELDDSDVEAEAY